MRGICLEMVLIGLEWITFFNLKPREIEVQNPQAVVASKPVIIEHWHYLELRNDEATVNMDSKYQHIVYYELNCKCVSDSSGLHFLLFPFNLWIFHLWHCAILSFLVSLVYVTSSIKHSLYDDEKQNDKERDCLSNAESVK